MRYLEHYALLKWDSNLIKRVCELCLGLLDWQFCVQLHFAGAAFEFLLKLSDDQIATKHLFP